MNVYTSVTYNIALIGNTTCGKSLFLDNFRFFNYLNEVSQGNFDNLDNLKDGYIRERSLYSQTFEPKIYPLNIVYEGSAYNLNILDSPGFKDTRREEDKQKNDESILKMFINAVDKDISKLNALIFVHSQKIPFTDESLDIFKRFKDILTSEMRNNCFILFTNCEGINLKKANDLFKCIEEDPKLLVIKQICGDRILLSGGLDNQMVTEFEDEELTKTVLESRCKKIISMQIECFNKIKTKTNAKYPVEVIIEIERSRIEKYKQKYNELKANSCNLQ